MCIPKLWPSRSRGQSVSPAPSQVPVHENDVGDVEINRISSIIECISHLVLNIPVYKQVLTEREIWTQTQKTLSVDVAFLLCLNNTIGEVTRTSEQYQETLCLIATSLQLISETSMELQSKQLSTTEATADIESIKRHLEMTRNNVKALALNEASKGNTNLWDTYQQYQLSHGQFQGLTNSNIQTSPGPSRQPSASPSGPPQQSDNEAQHRATPAPVSGSSALFAGSTNPGVTNSVLCTSASSITVDASNSTNHFHLHSACDGTACPSKPLQR
ncbi:hypothetical protein CPB83DRAFT_835043 [Crepidotus variabilis]|uniref:Uncharacterized protein n=1 Tax=Crepidotus variabilis TaxID=179855 RepID=A0A9P6EID1_9AGAR|nr:hypothetical protein CPB83DRAFT_835043 [Crepidotus variabilis]